MKTRRWLVAALVGLFACSCMFGYAEEKESHKIDMKQKLVHSKNILDGLVTEDFDKIKKHALALNELGQRNWRKDESWEYRTQNQLFWFTTGNLVIAAKEKNVDAATLAYTQMTLSCVHCHKLIRHE